MAAAGEHPRTQMLEPVCLAESQRSHFLAGPSWTLTFPLSVSQFFLCKMGVTIVCLPPRVVYLGLHEIIWVLSTSIWNVVPGMINASSSFFISEKVALINYDHPISDESNHHCHKRCLTRSWGTLANWGATAELLTWEIPPLSWVEQLPWLLHWNDF